ncbi:MAG: AraC family transcriptional regulator [Casimicrobiaceae bacterium]
MRIATETRHRSAIERVIRYMQRDPASPLCLDEMAQIACMSRFHFVRTFHEATSISPGKFLAALRIEKAKRLLLHTTRPVTAVCLEAGYASIGTFTYLFTQYVGVSPNRFRTLRDDLHADAMPKGLDTGCLAGAAGAATQKLTGVVSHAPGWDGLVFIGLFRSRIPRGQPLACVVLSGPSGFTLVLPPAPGKGNLHAFALPAGIDATDYLLPSHDWSWCASAALAKARSTRGIELRLRALTVFDPPTLFALPLLFGHGGPAVVALPFRTTGLRRIA